MGTAILEIPDFPKKGDKPPLRLELVSVQFGVGRSISSPSGQGTNREATAPNISEIAVTRLMDKYSPLLFQEALVGEARKMNIYLMDKSKDGKTIFTYLTVKLEGCLISNYSHSGSGDKPSEAISINFTKIESKHEAPSENAGKVQGPSYDP